MPRRSVAGRRLHPQVKTSSNWIRISRRGPVPAVGERKAQVKPRLRGSKLSDCHTTCRSGSRTVWSLCRGRCGDSLILQAFRANFSISVALTRCQQKGLTRSAQLTRRVRISPFRTTGHSLPRLPRRNSWPCLEYAWLFRWPETLAAIERWDRPCSPTPILVGLPALKTMTVYAG